VKSDDERSTKRSFDRLSPQLIVVLAAVAVAVVAVPAWARMDDGADDELEATAQLGEHARAVPAPIPGPAAGLPAPPADGAGQRGDFVVPVPPPPGASGEGPPEGRPGFAPPGPAGPFPLSDEQIEAEERALGEFVNCMQEQGVELGEPEVTRYSIAIPLPPDGPSDEFDAAAEECGGPPPPPLPEEAEEP
jgi:hypothetical protein